MLDLTFHRIHPDKVDRLRAWLAEVGTRREEALETFRREGTRHEIADLIETKSGPVLVYAIEREPGTAGQEAFLSSELAIDREHIAVLKECLVGWADAERLLDFAL